jgi:molecular chaperone HtpG
MADFPDSFNVVVNSNNPVIVNKLVKTEGEAASEMTEYLLSLALLQQGMLKGEALTSFVRKTLDKV